MRIIPTIAIILTYATAIACVDEPGVLECPESEVPSATAEANGLELRWPVEDCLPTSYDPDFESIRGDIQFALDAWENSSCGGLCFADPVPISDSAVPRGGIHVGHASMNRPDDPRGVTRTVYGLEDALIRQATIELDDDIPPNKLRRSLLRYVGLAIGFKAGDGRVESVMNDPDLDMLEDLTDADRDAYCAKYSACD